MTDIQEKITQIYKIDTIRKQIKIFVFLIVKKFSKYGHNACNNHKN